MMTETDRQEQIMAWNFVEETIRVFSEKYFLFLILTVLCIIMIEGVFCTTLLMYIASHI